VDWQLPIAVLVVGGAAWYVGKQLRSSWLQNKSGCSSCGSCTQTNPMPTTQSEKLTFVSADQLLAKLRQNKSQ
jgi:hypothetical protein